MATMEGKTLIALDRLVLICSDSWTLLVSGFKAIIPLPFAKPHLHFLLIVYV